MGNKEKNLFKHGKKIVFIAMLIFLYLVVFLALIPKANDINKIEITKPEISIAINKEVYHSSDEMNINASILLPKEDYVMLKIYGIPDRGGNYRISEERNISIGPDGVNETFTFRMPSCYGCAGVSPGEYEIVMEAWQNGEMVGNCSKTVILEK
jgi:hypothetical protein